MRQRRTLLVAIAALATLTRPTVAADTDTSASASTPSLSAVTPNPLTTASPPPSFVPFNWIVDNTDSILQYEDQSAWTTNTTSTSTASSGASVTFSFVGTEISILGTCDTSTGLLWTVDGTTTEFGPSSILSDHSQASESPVLVDARLDYGYHTVKLQLIGGDVSIQRINLTTGFDTQASSFENTTRSTEAFTSSNDFYHLSGTWGSSSDAHMNASPGASFWASIPANTSYFVLTGSSAERSTYTVSVSPAPPSNFPKVTQLNTRPSSSETTLLMAPLDPSVRYNVTFELDSDDATGMSLHSATFYSVLQSVPESSATQTSSPAASASTSAIINSVANVESSEESTIPSAAPAKSSNKGAIIGGSVGGGVGLIVLLALLFFLYRRSSAKKATKQAEEDTESASPYIPLPAGLRARSQSVLGLGTYLNNLGSSQPRLSVMQSTAGASSLSSYSNKDGTEELSAESPHHTRSPSIH